MSFIITSKTRQRGPITQQPRINPSHHLATGLRYAWVLNESAGLPRSIAPATVVDIDGSSGTPEHVVAAGAGRAIDFGGGDKYTVSTVGGDYWRAGMNSCSSLHVIQLPAKAGGKGDICIVGGSVSGWQIELNTN